MPMPSLNLLSRNSWPFGRRADREPRPARSQTDPVPAHRQPGAGIDNVNDPGHTDNSPRAQAIRGEYRRALRSGELPPRPANPPGYDGTDLPPYQPTPREREITVDSNLRGPVRDLRHPNTASQGLAESGSEHFRDFANPFRGMTSRNQAAPVYPREDASARPSADQTDPPQVRYLPFPHEKQPSLTETLRGRNAGQDSAYQPPSDRPGAPRRGPEVAPPRRGINWGAVGRGILNGLAAMGGAPMGRM